MSFILVLKKKMPAKWIFRYKCQMGNIPPRHPGRGLKNIGIMLEFHDSTWK